ncbi:MAG: RNA polymerase sigma factor [bacterium]|nr:RNA polymerase sigma factor [bacterium]
MGVLVGFPLELAASQVNSRQLARSARPVIDEAEFSVFYQRTARPLRGYLRAASGDSVVAEDLMQEAYMRFLRSGFTSDDAKYTKNYLFRIATNLLRDRHRRKRRGEPQQLEFDENVPAREKSFEMRGDMLKMMAGLKPRDRRMLWLAYVEGASHDEIAEIMKLKAASIRSMLFRARQRLAEILRENGFSAYAAKEVES